MLENFAIIFGLVAIWYLAQRVIYLCAKRGIFWVIPEEGYAIAIMKNGTFYKMLLAYTGYRFVQKVPDVVEDIDHDGIDAKNKFDNLNVYHIEPEENEEAMHDFMTHALEMLFLVNGIAWVGFPGFYEIYHFKHKWLDDKFQSREEEVGKILVQEYVYGLPLKDIELEGGIPYEIRLLVTLQVTNPAKALFRVGRYLDTALERIYGWSREKFSNLSFDDFVAKTTGLEGEVSSGVPSGKLAKALSEILDSAKELEEQFGVSIKKIQVVDIDPADERMRGITLKKEIAKQEAAVAIEKAHGEAEAIREKAKGEADAIRAKATADADAIRALNEATADLNSNALLFRGYQALENTKANITLIGKDLNLPAMLTIPATTKGGEE